MQPFLRWAGGKRWLVPQLVGQLPRFKTYYEPFVGSGGLFFALTPERAVLSDTNAELINCYRCVRNHCEMVIAILKRLRLDVRTYYRIRQCYQRADKIRRAAYFIYLNRTCWNGLYRVNRDGRFNVPVGDIGRVAEVVDADALRSASRALKRAELKCCDFEDAISCARRGDLVYFDPPYITTHLRNGFIKYNSRLFHEADEMRLAAMSQRLARRGVAVVVSNAAHPLIRQQYDGPFFKTEMSRASLIAANRERRRRFRELLITSFPLVRNDP